MNETQEPTSPSVVKALRRECQGLRRRCHEAEEEARRLRSLLAETEREVRNLQLVLRAFEQREACSPTRSPR